MSEPRHLLIALLAVGLTAAEAAQEAERAFSAVSDSAPPSASEADKKAHEYSIMSHGSYNPQAQAKAADKAALDQQLKKARPLHDSAPPETRSFTLTGNIYRCKQADSEVYADDRNRYKFRDCRLIRRAHPEGAAKPAQNAPRQTTDDNTPVQNRSPGGNVPGCSGAILYQGSTYVFNDSEPCPIPQAIFDARKPIEAEPSYYTQ